MKIALVLDTPSQEKPPLANSLVQLLQATLPVTVIRGNKFSTAEYTLVILPLERYLKSPTPTLNTVAYSTVPIDFFQLPEQTRPTILDLSQLHDSEAVVLITSLAHPQKSSGLRPLLDIHTEQGTTPIYCENWRVQEGLGLKMDQILRLPEITKSPWMLRSNSIRLLTLALWSLVEEDCPKRAYFQVSASPTFMGMRLYYTLKQNRSTNQSAAQTAMKPEIERSLDRFWPNRNCPSKPAQILLQFSNMVRINLIEDSNDIEITAGLFASVNDGKAQDRLHSFAIHSIRHEWIQELAYQTPNPRVPDLQVLPPVTLLPAGPNASLENLIEEFQKRYFEAKYQLRQFELQIIEMEKKGAKPKEIKELQQKMDALTNREKAWISQLMTTRKRK